MYLPALFLLILGGDTKPPPTTKPHQMYFIIDDAYVFLGMKETALLMSADYLDSNRLVVYSNYPFK